jgi:hypothetical protein
VTSLRALRLALTALLLPALVACSGTGVNAGEKGGTAFILFTAMLIVTVGVLAYFLGRED